MFTRVHTTDPPPAHTGSILFPESLSSCSSIPPPPAVPSWLLPADPVSRSPPACEWIGWYTEGSCVWFEAHHKLDII